MGAASVGREEHGGQHEAAEVLGALGLILPGLLRVKPWLMPLAAAGLVVIIIGATALTLASGEVGPETVGPDLFIRVSLGPALVGDQEAVDAVVRHGRL